MRDQLSPKEKAENIIARIEDPELSDTYIPRWVSKKLALITVDEILLYIDSEFQGFLDTDTISWWKEVKREINRKEII